MVARWLVLHRFGQSPMAQSLRKKLYSLLGLSLVVATVLPATPWLDPVVAAFVTAPGADVATETGPSEPLAYVALVGRQTNYKLNYEKSGGRVLAAALGAAPAATNAATKVRVAFILTSTTQASSKDRVTERWQLARGQVAVSVDGRLQQSVSRQLSADVREPFQVHLDHQGRLLGVELSPRLSPAARSMVEDIVTSVVVVLPDVPRQSWDVLEQLGSSPYTARYKVLGRTTGLAEKPLVTVQKRTSKKEPRREATPSQDVAAVGLAEGRLDVDFDPLAGRIERINGDLQGTLLSPEHAEESWRTSIRLVFLSAESDSAATQQSAQPPRRVYPLARPAVQPVAPPPGSLAALMDADT